MEKMKKGEKGEKRVEKTGGKKKVEKRWKKKGGKKVVNGLCCTVCSSHSVVHLLFLA